MHPIPKHPQPQGLPRLRCFPLRPLLSLPLVALLCLACQREPPDPFLARGPRGNGEPPSTASRSAENHAQQPELPALLKDGDAVFFVGNSFMGWKDRPLPEWVASLALALNPPLHLKVESDILFGNTPLGEFLTHPKTREAIASGKYRVFVLQAEEFEPVDRKPDFRRAVLDFRQAVTAAGGLTVLFMTWEFPWRRFAPELAAAYDQLGLELGIPVIPAGLVYWDCHQHPYAGEQGFWLLDEGLHQNEKGSAVNAYATLQMLTGRNPLGRNFSALGNSNPDPAMEYFSRMAWSRVEPRLRAGFVATNPRR